MAVSVRPAGETMNPKNLIEAGSIVMDLGLGSEAGAARAVLADEAASLARGARVAASNLEKRAGETIRTFADLLQGRAGDVVTVVPRRIIAGSSDGSIKPNTVSIDVLGPKGLMHRVETEKANHNLFGSDLAKSERRLHFLQHDLAQEQTHITLSLGNRIVGIGGVQTNPSNTSELWVQHVSVEARHQGKGYARNIIESIYDYALRRNQQVVPSSFTTEGQRLKAIFSRMNDRYPQARSSIPFKDI